MKIYHYKNGKKPGDWDHFTLSEEDGKYWNLFCQALAIKKPKDPNPYFSDYLMFLNERKINTN